MPNQIPLDPTLRAGFDNTRNEDRSKAELDAWWDHPYGVTCPDGKIEVRCLNGGAWDRSTHLGLADDYDAACVLAAEKQADWLRYRERPSFLMDHPKNAVILNPQRPDQETKRLIEVDTPEEARAYLEENFPDLFPVEARPAATPEGRSN